MIIELYSSLTESDIAKIKVFLDKLLHVDHSVYLDYFENRVIFSND